MKVKIVGAREARNNFADLLAWVMTGKEVVISRFGKPVAVLKAVEEENLFSFVARVRKKIRLLPQKKVDFLVEKIIASAS